LRAITPNPTGLPQAVLAQQINLSAAELPGILHRLEQYQLIERIDDRWRVQVELTGGHLNGWPGHTGDQ
jgi:DNA-binding IclR family transcriptional regulator